MGKPSSSIQAVPQMRRLWNENRARTRPRKQFRCALPRLYKPFIGTRQLAEFSRQLATLLAARLPLVYSLEIVIAQCHNPRFKRILGDILAGIQAGDSLSDSLQSQPIIFNELFISLVRVGEQGGILDKTLDRLADYLEKTARLQRKILTAMTYPLVIVLVAVGGISFLLMAVVLTFADMFRDFGSQLPAPTQFVLDVGLLLKANFWLMLALGAFFTFVTAKLRNTTLGARFFDRLGLQLPVVGSLLKKNFLTRFCRTLGTLLQSGVSLLPALAVVENLSSNSVFKHAVMQMKERIVKGQSMVDFTATIGPFTLLTIQMGHVGEETGELDEMLIKVAAFYEEELDATVEALTAVIEPVVIVILGIILGGTLVAMYLQLFNLVNVIQ